MTGSLYIPSNVELIKDEAFSFTSFEIKIFYYDEIEINCSSEIGFPQDQVIYVTDQYRDDSFCSFLNFCSN